MDRLVNIYYSTQVSWETAILSFLVAYLLSTLISKVYEATYEGLAWSKPLVQSLVLGSLITCLVMMAIGDNLARGIGIIGSLAVIRFRTNLRDPRDIIFVFASLATGIAAGVQSFIVAIVGSVLFCVIVLILRIDDYGSKRKYDGILRFQLPANSPASASIAEILKRETRHYILVAMQNIAQGDFVDYTYHIKLMDPENAEKFLHEFDHISEINGLKYMSQQSPIEV